MRFFLALLLAAPAAAVTRSGAPERSFGGAVPALPSPMITLGVPRASMGTSLNVPGLETGVSNGAIRFDGQTERARMNEPEGRSPVSGDAQAPSSSQPLAPSTGHESEAPKEPEAPRREAPKAQSPAPWKSAIPNAITALNLVSGLGAILASGSGAYGLAAALILLANVFDALDGRAARALGVAGDMGIQLDSLADVVSFGLAPAVLAYSAALSPLGPVGFAAAAVFAAAGAYRLARFNVGAQAEKEGRVPPKPGDHFTGMPIPAGAGVLVAGVLAAPALGAYAPYAIAALAAVAAAAMVSKLPYPAFKKGGFKALAVPGILAAAVSAGLWLSGAPLLAPAAVFGLYLLAGPGVAFWRGSSDAFRKEFKRKAFHQLSLLYLAAYFVIPPAHRVAAFAAWTGVVAAVELARLYWKPARRFFERWFGGIIRAKEAEHFSGSFYATLGLAVTAALWGANPAVMAGAVLALSLGDAASPLVGLRFGVGRFKVAGTQRSVDGALAGFAVVLAIGLSLGFSPLVAALAALVFSAVDLYPVKPDDNLWIPIAFGTALALLPRLLG